MEGVGGSLTTACCLLNIHWAFTIGLKDTSHMSRGALAKTLLMTSVVERDLPRGLGTTEQN